MLISVCPLRLSEEFSRDVETDEPIVAGLPAACQLGDRGAESVREVQLKAMTSCALLDAEAAVHRVWRIAKSRDHLADQVHRRPYPQAPAQSHDERVVALIGEFGRLRIRVVHPDGVCIERTVAPERAGDDRADRWGVAFGEVGQSIYGADDVDADLTLLLAEQVLLPEEFDGAVAGPVYADLGAGHDPETVFEANLRTGIESEEVADQIAEVAGTERTAEPVRH